MRAGRWGVLALLLGCASNPNPQAQEVAIVCKNWPNQCYYKAQAKCTNGYTVLSKVEVEKNGGPEGRYREYTVRVQCQK